MFSKKNDEGGLFPLSRADTYLLVKNVFSQMSRSMRNMGKLLLLAQLICQKPLIVLTVLRC